MIYDWETEDRLIEEDGNAGKGIVLAIILSILFFWGPLAIMWVLA